jgi:hypothetical protein
MTIEGRVKRHKGGSEAGVVGLTEQLIFPTATGEKL